MKKVLTVIGARPQIIKASAVSHVILSNPGLHEVLVHTGQHYDADMSDVFFQELGLAAPHHHLGIGGGGHGEMTGRMLMALEGILASEDPDLVLVYGDTNSTLAGALAAVKLHIPVAHVEAGLRSFNMRMPEEVNRVLTDRISHWLFTPNEVAVRNLRAEGVRGDRVVEVGDVMYDVALAHGARVDHRGGAMGRLGLTPKEFILTTIHRAENTDDQDRLEAIVKAMAHQGRSLPVVWPLHPRTRGALEKGGHLTSLGGKVHLVEPLGYLDMVQLEKYAAVVVTDSGGVQKEAFFQGVPCVTVRDETEWVELVEAGWNRLSPPSSVESILSGIGAALGSQGAPIRPYGDGDAAQRIVRALLDA